MEQLLKDTFNLLLQSTNWTTYRHLALGNGAGYAVGKLEQYLLEQYLTDDSVRNKASRTQQEWVDLQKFIELGYLTTISKVHEVSGVNTICATPEGQWLLETLDVFKRYREMFDEKDI